MVTAVTTAMAASREESIPASKTEKKWIRENILEEDSDFMPL